MTLPGPSGESAESTLESILAEGIPAERIVGLDETVARFPDEVTLLALIRAGDRWLAGHLDQHRRALAAEPGAAISTARYLKVDQHDTVICEGGLPPGPIDPCELALRCPIEASATVLRISELEPSVFAELAQPGGDVALWCAMVEHRPVARVPDVTAHVCWDPARHGADPATRIEALRPLARSGHCSSSLAAVIRRELLSLMYLQGHMPPEGFDAAELAGDDGLDAVIADLQWTLERQSRQLEALWGGWPHARTFEPGFLRLEWPEDRIVQLEWQEGVLRTEHVVLNEEIELLRARLRQRETLIARLHQHAPTLPGRK